MRLTRFICSTAAATLVAAVTLGLATPAFAAGAADGGRLDTLKQRADQAVDRRITSLQEAIIRVNAQQHLGSDQALLTGRMQDDITGLQALDATIQADATIAAARADATKIFTDYRVYALVLPVTRMVVASDTMTNVAIPKLSDATGKLQDAITKKGAADLQPKLDDMKAKIAAASSSLDGLVAEVEGFTPAQWNADHDLLTADRGRLQGARADLAAARQDARAIVQGLRGTGGSTTTTTNG